MNVNEASVEAPAKPSARPVLVKSPTIYRGYGSYLQLLGVLLLLAAYHQSRGGDPVGARLLDVWLWYTIVVLGFWVVFGAAGQFAFCHAAFVGLGAYTGNLWWGERNAWPGLLLAAAFSAVVAAAFALIVRKASHLYFAIVTLGLAMIAGIVWQQYSGLTHGLNGIVTNITPITVFGNVLDSDHKVFWLLWALVGLLFLARIWIARSPSLREMIAFRDAPVVAELLGVPVFRIRLVSFVAGSVVAGIAGAVYAHWNRFSSPDAFSLNLAIAVFVMLVLGGTNALWGPILGAAFYTYLPQVLPVAAGWQFAIYGALLVIVIIVFPGGFGGVVAQVRNALTQRRRGGGVEGRNDGLGPASDTEYSLTSRTSPPIAEDAPVVLSCRDVHVSFGGVRAVDGVSLDIRVGEILGLIGPNGSGKSTLLNGLGGIVAAHGELVISGRRVKLGRRPGRMRRAGILRTFQTPQPIAELTCIENVLLASPDRRWTGIGAALLLRPLMLRRERRRWAEATAVLERVGLLALADARAGDLSYGQQRMLELARAMAGEPKVLMLDEPSAGLTGPETAQLAGYLDRLRAEGIAMILVDHKIDLIASLCDRVVALDLGRKIADGPPEQVVEDPHVVDAYLGIAE